jgi:uncharacterized protein (TIGR03437 family)
MIAIRHYTWLTLFGAALSYAQSPVKASITSVLDPYTASKNLSPGSPVVITALNMGFFPTVTVGGISASILVPPLINTYLTMTIQIPVNAPVGASVPVVVTTGAGPSAPFNITLTQYAPVLIASTFGALTSPRHQDSGVAVTSSTPATRGETINIYAIGLGPTNPAVNTGALGPANPAADTTGALEVTINGSPVSGTTARLASSQGFFGGNTPGGGVGSASALIGIYILSFAVPSGMLSGVFQAALTIGGVASNSVTVAVGQAPTVPVITAIVGEDGIRATCAGDVVIVTGLNLGTNPSVTVGGKPAFVMAPPNGGNQMTIQIPVDLPLGNAQVVVTPASGTSSPQFQITLLTSFPAVQLGGNGQPLVPVHQSNFTPVTQASPAVPGETVVIFAYGLGATSPVVPTGTVTPQDPPAISTIAPKVSIAGTQVQGTGFLIPGQVGIYGVAFTVPQDFTNAGVFATWIVSGMSQTSIPLQIFNGPVISSVSNAASTIVPGLPNSGIAQGAIFIAKGVGLGPAALSVAVSQDIFQKISLSGTSASITVNGTTVAALMYYTSGSQISGLLPSNTPTGIGTMTVTYNGTVGLAAPIEVVQSNVGIFTPSGDGIGTAIITNPDYSLVTATKAANCGAVYSSCGAANPGDVLILWATGLGPVNGSDTAGAGLGVPMTFPLTIWIGNVALKSGDPNLIYYGRSGCCIGEDQVVFKVPQNVQFGCAVPISIQIGNLISNYAVMPIAQTGRTCAASKPSLTNSVVIGTSTTTAPINFGQVQLSREPNANGQGQVNGNIDYAEVDLFTFTLPPALQPFWVSYADNTPNGTCSVFNSLTRPDVGNYIVAGKALDAGPSIKITGPNGSQSAPSNAQYTLSSTGNFLNPGAYTITGTGGADVGLINAQVNIPTPPTPTVPANATFMRANGATVTWTGGSPGSVVWIRGISATDNSFTNGAGFVCFADAGAGTLTVPASVLLALPAGSSAVWDLRAFTYGSFTASGLNLGVLQMFYDVQFNATLQ